MPKSPISNGLTTLAGHLRQPLGIKTSVVIKSSVPVFCNSFGMYSINCPSNIPDCIVSQMCLVTVELEDRICTLESRISRLVEIKQIEGFIDTAQSEHTASLDLGVLPAALTVSSPTPTPAANTCEPWVTVRRGPRSSKTRAPAHQWAAALSNTFSALCSTSAEAEKVLVTVNLIIRLSNYQKAVVPVKCLPGARDSNIEAKLDSLSSNEASTLVVHTGTNDIKSRQSKVLKRNFRWYETYFP